MQHRLVLEIELLCCSSGQGLNQSIERSSNAQSSEGECCIETLVGACVGNLEHERRIRGIQRLETPVLVIVARERRDAIVTRQTELENCVFECLVAREAWCSFDRSHVFRSRMNGWMRDKNSNSERVGAPTSIVSVARGSIGRAAAAHVRATAYCAFRVPLLLLVSLPPLSRTVLLVSPPVRDSSGRLYLLSCGTCHLFAYSPTYLQCVPRCLGLLNNETRSS